MRNKFTENADHYLTEQNKKIYILTQVESQAFSFLESRIQSDVENTFKKANDILNVLQSIYEDQNKKRTA